MVVDIKSACISSWELMLDLSVQSEAILQVLKNFANYFLDC